MEMAPEVQSQKILFVLEETECHDDEYFWTYVFIVDEEFEKESTVDLKGLAKGISTGSIRAESKCVRPKKRDASTVYHGIPVPPGVSRVILARVSTLQAMIASCYLKKELIH